MPITPWQQSYRAAGWIPNERVEARRASSGAWVLLFEATIDHAKEQPMDNQTLILILVILLVLGAFGGFSRGRWRR
jgi:hypothetical protein